MANKGVPVLGRGVAFALMLEGSSSFFASWGRHQAWRSSPTGKALCCLWFCRVCYLRFLLCLLSQDIPGIRGEEEEEEEEDEEDEEQEETNPETKASELSGERRTVLSVEKSTSRAKKKHKGAHAAQGCGLSWTQAFAYSALNP